MSICTFSFLLFLTFARDISNTAEPIFTKSSRKMANGLQLKSELLVSELFRGGREVEKGHFRFGPSFTICNMAAKWIYLSKKRKLSDFGRR